LKYTKIELISLVALLSLSLIVPLLSVPRTEAHVTYINVNVTADPQSISPGQEVDITCWAEMDGKGVVFVVQPDVTSSAAQCPNDLQNSFNQIFSDPDCCLWKIISYAIVDEIVDPEGGQQVLVFPRDFTGLNGQPSTNQLGKYYIFFVFWHNFMCFCMKIGFDCTTFWVVPEYPLGTVIAVTVPALALFSQRWIKSRKQIKK
jgi:hypothetical protein